MRDVCKTILIGTVVSDPVTRYLETLGGSVTTMKVETRKTWKDRVGAEKSRTSTHTVCVFGKQADMAATEFRHGSRVYAEVDIVYKSGVAAGSMGVELQAQYLTHWDE